MRKAGVGKQAIAFVSMLLAANAYGQSKAPRYVAPDIVSEGDIAYPVNTTATGLVTLLLSLDNSARVTNTQVLRDIPTLTSAAQSAAQTWSFKPASFNGKPVASSIPVSVVFSPFNPGDTETSGMSVAASPPATPAGAAQYTPPQITSASFAMYPPNTLAQGTVVLDVAIGKTGQVTGVQVVRGVEALTGPAVSAVKTWSYSPASANGRPIAAKVVIAFVFQRNLN